MRRSHDDARPDRDRALGVACALGLVLVACGSGADSLRTPRGEGASVVATEAVAPPVAPEASPRERARAGGWTGAPLQPPPHYCDEQGGTEWCEGEHDDDCDGEVDEGCADCVHRACVRYEIAEAQMRQGTGRAGVGRCVGPVYCGRIDGYATTSPPGGCGDFHCATVVWPDGTAQPHHCTIYGRCVGGEFQPKGFSW